MYIYIHFTLIPDTQSAQISEKQDGCNICNHEGTLGGHIVLTIAYVYIYRERERKRERYVYIYTSRQTHTYMYEYIFCMFVLRVCVCDIVKRLDDESESAKQDLLNTKSAE